jgi:hypothetical protein
MHARTFLIALLCYGGLSAWFHQDLLRAPGTVLPHAVGVPETHAALQWGDEQMVVATIGSVARRLLTAPGRIHDLGQCYPFPNSLTLGEPMFVDALVGAVPFAITGNPIAAKNFVTVTAPVLAGLSMFALILYWTGSVPAALVAGLLFGFEPSRLEDISHPYVHGNAWAPLVLLFTHRLFARRRWRDAALLAIALALQMLESFYPALALALVGVPYGVVLAVHHRRTLPALLPKLAAVGLFLALIGRLAFGPYFENRDVWGVLQGRGSLLLHSPQFHFGGPSYLGTVLLVLAAVALLDRLRRGPIGFFDPRLPLLVAGAFVYWFVLEAIAVPLVGIIPSPYTLGLRELPGISAVRAVSAVRIALPFVGSCLAGFGLAALLRHRGPVARRTIGTVVFALALADLFVLPPSGFVFAQRFQGVPAKPAASLLAMLDSLPPGPVLDFPPSRFIPPSTHYVLLHGFHDRPTDACHSSFPSPMRDQVYALSARLPDSVAAIKLRTLGFRAIVVHTEFLMPQRLAAFTRWAKGDGRRVAGLRRIGKADGHIAYVFAPPPPTDGLAALTLPAVVLEQRMQPLDAPGKPLAFVVRNSAPGFYRHPDPIRPDPVALVWRDALGTVRASESVRELLPLALGPGEKERIEVTPGVLPPPGPYTVTLHLRDAAGPVIARQRVVILPSAGQANVPAPAAAGAATATH